MLTTTYPAGPLDDAERKRQIPSNFRLQHSPPRISAEPGKKRAARRKRGLFCLADTSRSSSDQQSLLNTSSAMDDGTTLNRDTVLSLLNPLSVNVFVAEEKRHPWRTNYFQTFDRPFLRLWDHFSGSQPANDGFMRSRAARERLDTFESRKESLRIHINHRLWEPTPFISFTTSPSKIEDLARSRPQPRRGPHNLTAVDPNYRVRNGLPVLHVYDEMSSYDIADPYNRSNRYYEDHYICLWEVTDGEIIGHWQWDDLVVNANWYQETIMPAFRNHREASRPQTLSNLFSGLSLSTNPSDPHNGRFSESSSEGPGGYLDDEFGADDGHDDSDDFPRYSPEIYDSDTDDEVEESNANDDIMKILEGDW